MILVIDFDNTRQDILLAGADSVRRFSSLPGKGFRSLEDVLELMRREGHDRADGVAVVLMGEGPAQHPSESPRHRYTSQAKLGIKVGGVPPEAGSGAGEKERRRGGEKGLPCTGAKRLVQGRNMSWSTVRAAVALANALAFAWGVPAVSVIAGEGTEGAEAVEGEEENVILSKRSIEALKEVPVDARVSATYDGEPNITRPKRES